MGDQIERQVVSSALLGVLTEFFPSGRQPDAILEMSG